MTNVTAGGEERRAPARDSAPLDRHGLAIELTVPPVKSVQYTFVALTAMEAGSFCVEESVVTVPPPMGTSATESPVWVTQYTFVASTVIPNGWSCPEASVVGVPPPRGTLITVPATKSVQYMLVASTAMPNG
jgi:hypothetical protein